MSEDSTTQTPVEVAQDLVKKTRRDIGKAWRLLEDAHLALKKHDRDKGNA